MNRYNAGTLDHDATGFEYSGGILDLIMWASMLNEDDPLYTE